ncbi:IS1634 family transposase, partial [Thiohalocapsa sp.]|uniref:IS1634 family transposase n=1 Tax=Thiohalocapsa sp. TaxID=2497641 RepID=UPI0025E6B752
MYLRTTQRRNKDGSTVRYLALAENARHPEKGHVEARIVHHFGRADQLDRAVLERLVASIRRVLARDGSGAVEAGEGQGSGGEIAIEAVHDLGVPHVVRELWTKLGIAAAIASRVQGKRQAAAHQAALLAMAAQRLDRPGSKLACHERWRERVWLPEARALSLGQLYRALDLLTEHGEAIEAEVFWHGAELFDFDVDLIFYDATTAWFETDDEDVATHEWRGLEFAPLRRRGHSKEGRDNHPQVVIALAITRDGMPVRSWVFPGNTPDVTAVARIKRDLKAIRLGRTLFVGDAGLSAKANLAELSQGAGSYVLAVPIGRSKEVRDEVLSHPGRYAEIAPHLRAKEVVLGQGERRRRYVLCLNDDEAFRQQQRRRALPATLEAELDALAGAHPKAASRLPAPQPLRPIPTHAANRRPLRPPPHAPPPTPPPP